MIRPRLIVMVKEPRPGRVKTRLARDLGTTAAAWWYRHQSLGLIRRLRDPRWDMTLAVAPDRALRSPAWPLGLPRRPQGRGDLGARMRRQLQGVGPVCVIGSDIPGIRRHHIAHGFARLGGHDGVLGPAEDGGYWLVGWHNGTHVPKTIFHNVRWSSEHALTDTVASVPGARLAFVDQLRDVDTMDDLQGI